MHTRDLCGILLTQEHPSGQSWRGFSGNGDPISTRSYPDEASAGDVSQVGSRQGRSWWLQAVIGILRGVHRCFSVDKVSYIFIWVANDKYVDLVVVGWVSFYMTIWGELKLLCQKVVDFFRRLIALEEVHTFSNIWISGIGLLRSEMRIDPMCLS